MASHIYLGSDNVVMDENIVIKKEVCDYQNGSNGDVMSSLANCNDFDPGGFLVKGDPGPDPDFNYCVKFEDPYFSAPFSVDQNKMDQRALSGNQLGEVAEQVNTLIDLESSAPDTQGRRLCCSCSRFFDKKDWEEHLNQYLKLSGCFPTMNYKMKKNESRLWQWKKQYSCKLCSFEGADWQVKEHVRGVHKQLLVCALCDAVMLTHFHLQSHLHMTHHLPVYLKCLDCKFKPTNIDSLKIHTQNYHFRSRYACDKCGRGFWRKDSLSRHFQREHIPVSEKDRISCPHCRYTTLHDQCLKRHLRAMHSGPQEKKFQCSQCNYMSINKTLLNDHIIKVHMSDHSRDYKCRRCQLYFLTLGGLITHNRIHSSTPERFPCRLCEKTFGACHLLFIHINLDHLSRDKFQCDLCPSLSESKLRLISHIRKNHLLSFTCHHCNLKKKSKQALLYHISFCHLKIKRFKCDKCRYKSTTKHLLNQHTNVKHNPNPLVYQCYHCGHRNKIKHKLSQHMQTKHADILRDKMKKKRKKTVKRQKIL